MVKLDGADPLSEDFRSLVGVEIDTFITDRATTLANLGPELGDLASLASAFTAGGKRLRPAFCSWGYLSAAGGDQLPESVLRAAASLDLLHVSALIHDDVMDASQTRRGLPAAHVQLAARHAAAGNRGSAEDFGRGGAILLGDLLLMWSVELFNTCGVAPAALGAAQPLIAAVRAEVTGGQYLDITAQTRPLEQARRDPEEVLGQVRRVVEYKTARYTVIRPLQIGAALGGGDAPLLAMLAAYGSPLGRAFQYRDDILGVFGDERLTGKPTGDDLREGKLTVLVVEAMARASEAAAARLQQLLGTDLDAAGVAEAQSIIVDSGALATTEAEVTRGAEQAWAALAGIDEPARSGLTRLVELSTQRDS